MRFLVDTCAANLAQITATYGDLVLGQLQTPGSRYANAGGVFAIDNGAFSGFDSVGFQRLLHNNLSHQSRCLWVATPDVVGSARRTLEVFPTWESYLHDRGWPVALVAQDGLEDLEIPWHRLACLFVGGTDAFKDSQSAVDCLRAARILGVRTHVGRVNSPKRFKRFNGFADTCDGSGIARFSDAMLPKIVRMLNGDEFRPLLDTGGDSVVDRLRDGVVAGFVRHQERD